MRGFESLSEQEILALAITLEEEDEKIYANFAEGLRQDFPATAAVFDGMRVEESGHRRRLIELSQKKFGDHIPLIRRQDVRGFVSRKPVWMTRPLRLELVRNTCLLYTSSDAMGINGSSSRSVRIWSNSQRETGLSYRPWQDRDRHRHRDRPPQFAFPRRRGRHSR